MRTAKHLRRFCSWKGVEVAWFDLTCFSPQLLNVSVSQSRCLNDQDEMNTMKEEEPKLHRFNVS